MLNAHINIATTFQKILWWKYEILLLIQMLQVNEWQAQSIEYHYIKFDIRREGEQNKQLKKASLPSYIKDLADLDDHNKIL